MKIVCEPRSSGLHFYSATLEDGDARPCPFCGSGHHLEITNTWTAVYTVECECGAEMSGVHASDLEGFGKFEALDHDEAAHRAAAAEALAAWNTRPGKEIAASSGTLHPQVGSTGNMMVVWTLAQTVSGPDGGTSTVYWTGEEHPSGLGPLVTSRLHRAGTWPTQAAAAKALSAHRTRLPGYSVRPVTVHVVEAEEWWPHLVVTAPEAIAS